MRVARVAPILFVAVACTRTVVVRTQPEPERRPPPVVEGNTARDLGIPPGHLPRPGECRIWLPGVPPGRQMRPRSRRCANIERDAPAGSWIVYRPGADRRYVHIRMVDERRPGIVVRVRIFEIETGAFVREENP